MNVKELQQKSDKELINAYTFLKDFICQTQEITAKQYDEYVETVIQHQYYKARKSVKMVKIALNELEGIFSTLHVQVTEETLNWSSMEDTRFNTTDVYGLQQVIDQAFN